MLEQRTVAAGSAQVRALAEASITGGDFSAADAAYDELHRLGELTSADAGNWLRALRALGVRRQQPSLRELVESFPDDQDILEFVAAELWQRAESRAEQSGGAEDDELARRAWTAALRMAGPVPETDADGVRLISLLDRFFQAGRRQRTPVGSYPEFEQALYRFASAGPDSTLRAADLLAAESPALALELVARTEVSSAAVLVRAVASAELEDFATAARLFDELDSRWGVGVRDLDVEDRSRWIQAMTDVGRFAEAEEACLRTITAIEGGPASAGWATVGVGPDSFEHWRHVYRLLAYRLAAQQGRYRAAWDHLRKSIEVDDTGLPTDLRRSILRVRILLADPPMALGILDELRGLDTPSAYDTAYAEAALWAGTQWGTPVSEGRLLDPENPFAGARYSGQAAARALLAQAGPEVDSRQLVRLALLAGDDDRAAAILTAEPLTAEDPWSVQVLAAMLALRTGDDAGAHALLDRVLPSRRHDLDLRVLEAQALLIAGRYKDALREAMAITDGVGEHILARTIQAESEFETALAMADDSGGGTGSVENAQQLMVAVADYRMAADLHRDTKSYLETGRARPGARVGSEPLAPRLFSEVCRRGLHAAILAQEGLDRLGLKGDAQLVDDAQDLVQHLRSVTRPCCRRWGPRWSRLLHQLRHITDRDEASRLALLMVAYRWAGWRKRLQNAAFFLLGAVITWLGLTGALPGPESDALRVTVVGVGVLLMLMPFARSLKVGVVELSRDVEPAPLSGRSKSLRTSRLLLRANHLGTFAPPSPPEKGRRAHATSRRDTADVPLPSASAVSAVLAGPLPAPVVSQLGAPA
jgi:tetratricopeptide (TPR) repeat protein